MEVFRPQTTSSLALQFGNKGSASYTCADEMRML